MGGHKYPYVTVVAVWIVSSLGLALLVSFPISSVVLFSVVLFLVLAVAGSLLYKVRHKDLDNRALYKNLSSDLRGLVVKISKDFGSVFDGVSAWWLRREARIREEMAQEHERQARRKERLAQLERKRSTRPANQPPTAEEYEYVQRIERRLQEKQTEG